MRRAKIWLFAAMVVVSGVSSAGGCLQGTWTYYSAEGAVVGSETVGCGTDDGAWGTRTANKTFSQGCAASS
jgi:hypothetical protein